MYEYTIINLRTNKETTIFGRTYVDACHRRNLQPADFEVVWAEYVD